ncbi:putative bifunctional diguanylate cyclase/phosphodiesterase [Mesorhizobium sp. ANAO-SY3R2]|uniref:putative bifunctional diguanylate cyclase/phosphodiesterase n=1 Tax=Mesorhizobium sp. ANAO-SY3R2 TaxID=3166644 RepID=UPI00366D474F
MDQCSTLALANMVGVDMHEAGRGEPSKADLYALYRMEGDGARRAAARHGLWVAVAVYLLFAITDVLLIPDVSTYTIVARLVICVFVLTLLEVQVLLDVRTAWLDGTCAIALVLGYAGWLSLAILTEQSLNFSYYMIFGAIFMMGANLFFNLQFRLSVVASGTILATFFVALYFLHGSAAYKLTFATFYVSCFTFTSFVNWKLNNERFNVFLNALEAKAQQHEATERGKALLRLSRTDPLTGLENRRAIDEKLRDYWNDWQHAGIGFAAVLIDVDFFKKFNDSYGHQRGDRCLVLIAEALRETIEQYHGTIGRYGGEEFIALARMDSRQQVEELAESIRLTVENLGLMHDYRRDGMSVVTVSVGAAFTRKQAGDTKLEKIIYEADRALYLAKASGRNCTWLFDPNDPQSSDESENIAALLKIATSQNLISLVYQPIMSLASGRIEGVEALMRLKMHDGTPVSPSLFIPIAERTGAILELGRWTVRTACRELLSDSQIRVVSVNVSPIQLKTPGFATSIAAILGETGVDGSRLAFEITEGLEMEMDSGILRCIADLKLLGIRIWLDDFGTGFAGLSWLRLIDFDTVKIDRSFLHASSDARGRAMLQDIIGLVRNRGHKILVEGVETAEQMELMREFGIDQVQGFLVGRPAPAEDFRHGQGSHKEPVVALKSA